MHAEDLDLDGTGPDQKARDQRTKLRTANHARDQRTKLRTIGTIGIADPEP